MENFIGFFLLAFPFFKLRIFISRAPDFKFFMRGGKFGLNPGGGKNFRYRPITDFFFWLERKSICLEWGELRYRICVAP
ncbi:MAG: hypothetical protein J6J65_06985 [Opitutales bacterium]|nr:hypothetical protein [Opitutales bacterium]